jgi:hypothetical protein
MLKSSVVKLVEVYIRTSQNVVLACAAAVVMVSFETDVEQVKTSINSSADAW